jgi:hypothetical protein
MSAQPATARYPLPTPAEQNCDSCRSTRQTSTQSNWCSIPLRRCCAKRRSAQSTGWSDAFAPSFEDSNLPNAQAISVTVAMIHYDREVLGPRSGCSFSIFAMTTTNSVLVCSVNSTSGKRTPGDIRSRRLNAYLSGTGLVSRNSADVSREIGLANSVTRRHPDTLETSAPDDIQLDRLFLLRRGCSVPSCAHRPHYWCRRPESMQTHPQAR